MMANRPDELPPRSQRIFAWFRWYCRRYYFPAHFHALRLLPPTQYLAGDHSDPDPATPLVILANHPSWWDPVVCTLLSARFPTRVIYSPIDARALETYRFFRKLGFFGVEQGTARGAARFLQCSRAVLDTPGTILWITAQGRFTDPRSRPVTLMPGLARVLARWRKPAMVLPLAIEYPFWDERSPEALAHFGEPLQVDPSRPISAEAWGGLLAGRLEQTMDNLALAGISRDPGIFHTLHTGRAGVGGMYDRIRRASAWLGLRRFDGTHAAAIAVRKTKEIGDGGHP